MEKNWLERAGEKKKKGQIKKPSNGALSITGRTWTLSIPTQSRAMLIRLDGRNQF
jgi:hypothetical protein